MSKQAVQSLARHGLARRGAAGLGRAGAVIESEIQELPSVFSFRDLPLASLTRDEFVNVLTEWQARLGQARHGVARRGRARQGQ